MARKASLLEVVFHAGKGKQTRPVLSGADLKPTFEHIPTVDFRNATSDVFEERLAVAREVGKAFTEVGFLYALNHGIDADLQDRVTTVIKDFFALPHDEKMKIHINKSPAIKGYEPLLETRIDDKTRGDLKEAFNMADDPYEPEQKAPADLDLSTYPVGPLNQWPTEPAAFRSTIYEYRAAAQGFAAVLLRLIALAVDLPENYFDHMAVFPMAGLRALHYPPQAPSDDDVIGIGAHADYSWVTLVNQLTSAPALEVLNANGHWVSAPPVKDSLVVNVGDFLERATNDRFVSTVHRVRNISGAQRFSLAYFFSPSHEVMIRTLPTCLAEGETPKYPDIKAGEWQRERLLRARVNHPASKAARERGEI
ncbi:Clavaminate synthase-like protein [Stachybotrys elegans]|uniref:Clavaminate synthase-like protein n=1 Tax=Stachybotrys elegans TaxID=80388 RepID=A0A8K0T3U4_9HYPO|nr:Clavaminate synthase-like protein [Stachybotrys elegans]